MKYLDFYQKELNCRTEDEVFDFFIKNLKPSFNLWDYFVNWNKVFANTREIEYALTKLNYLIGKKGKEFDTEFKFLLGQDPDVAQVIPALLVRDGSNSKKFNIFIDYEEKKLVCENYDFSKVSLTDDDIEKYLKFVQETKLKNLFCQIKCLKDYMIGVEAGLDSNGRKNRRGTMMETISEIFIKDLCTKKNYRYLKEATATQIKEAWGYDVPSDKSSRRYDFAIDNGQTLFVIETNFYGGDGSKLKSTAGEYKTLFDILHEQHQFIWITDGFGWKSTHRPLRETFDHNDYIFNLTMLEKGILGHLIAS